MNLYNKIKSTEFEIYKSFEMKSGQMLDFVQHSHNSYDLAYIAFKFGYMQGCRAEQHKKYVVYGKKELIHRMVDDIADDSRIERIFNMVHRNFIRDKEEKIT